jgi:aspartate racemase
LNGSEAALHIGLIGGIGPAATDFYYRRLISRFAKEGAPLDLTIVHADTPTLLANLAANNAAAQVEIYLKLTARLAAAGAQCVVVTSIAGHFCIEESKKLSPLPVVDLISAVGQSIKQRHLKRIGILGTKTAMLTKLYCGVPSADLVAPQGADLDAVHQAYIGMAAAGVVTAAQRDIFLTVGHRLMNAAGCEAIMLGGTDLALVFNEEDAPFPLVDCAGIHADEVARLALSSGSEHA